MPRCTANGLPSSSSRAFALSRDLAPLTLRHTLRDHTVSIYVIHANAPLPLIMPRLQRLLPSASPLRLLMRQPALRQHVPLDLVERCLYGLGLRSCKASDDLVSQGVCG